LHAELVNRAAPYDFIGLSINSEGRSRCPVWLSFRPVRDFLVEELGQLLFNLSQNSSEYCIQDRLKITCHVVEGVRGSGRVKLTEDTDKKKSTLTIQNDDSLC